MTFIHIAPHNDLIVHSATEDGFCICNPKHELHVSEAEEDIIVVRHFAFDGRPESRMPIEEILRL